MHNDWINNYRTKFPSAGEQYFPDMAEKNHLTA